MFDLFIHRFDANLIHSGDSTCLDVHVDVANQRSARSTLAVWSYSIKSDPTENAVQSVGPATMRALNVFYLICPFKCKVRFHGLNRVSYDTPIH